jgi:hypothetical protein
MSRFRRGRRGRLGDPPAMSRLCDESCGKSGAQQIFGPQGEPALAAHQYRHRASRVAHEPRLTAARSPREEHRGRRRRRRARGASMALPRLAELDSSACRFRARARGQKRSVLRSPKGAWTPAMKCQLRSLLASCLHATQWSDLWPRFFRRLF